MAGPKAGGGISRMAMKAMGIFGGVQVMTILCSIVRTKLVALWIGPVGVGLFGLMNNALEMLNTATNLGVRNSSVRDISQAAGGHDRSLVGRIIAVVRRWSLWLGLGGALLTVAVAPLLSEVTFGDQEHVWSFVALSAAVLLMALTNGEQAVLQGTARLKRLAQVTLWGNVCGLAVSVPLFYWLRQDSILPSILAYALAMAVWAWVLRSRDYAPVRVDRRTTAAVGAGFVKLGIFMTIGNFAAIVASYIFNAWLNHAGGTHEVGLYQAGYTLVNKYTGLILAALGMEYYPRLSRVAHSPKRLKAFVSQEVFIAMAVMAPVAGLFVLLRQPIVWLLYSSEFQGILTLVAWGMIGCVWRTLSWCLAFVILARGDGRVYLITEVTSAVIGLVLNMVCYRVWGITGLGVSFLLWYVAYTLIVGFVYAARYGLRLSGGSLLATLWTLVVAGGAMACMEAGWLVPAAALVLVSVVVALWQLKALWQR